MITTVTSRPLALAWASASVLAPALLSAHSTEGSSHRANVERPAEYARLLAEIEAATEMNR